MLARIRPLDCYGLNDESSAALEQFLINKFVTIADFSEKSNPFEQISLGLA